MGYTVGDWVKGLIVSGIVVILGLFVTSASTGFGLLIAGLGAALGLFCFIGLTAAQKKVQQYQQAAQNFEAKAQPDKKTGRW